MNDISISVMWIEKCIYQPERVVMPHTHIFFHCIYPVQGEGFITIGDNKQIIKENTFYMAAPDVLHSFGAGKEALHVFELKFGVSNQEISEEISNLPNTLLQKDSEILELLGKMKRESTQKHTLYTDLLDLKCLEILTLLKRQGKVKVSKSGKIIGKKNRFLKVEEYINANLNNKITLESLANIMCLEKTHFLKQFKKETGRAPMKYVKELRIKKAKELLQYSDMNITQIADIIGFGSIHYFSRTFTEEVGTSPAKYRIFGEVPYL